MELGTPINTSIIRHANLWRINGHGMAGTDYFLELHFVILIVYQTFKAHNMVNKRA